MDCTGISGTLTSFTTYTVIVTEKRSIFMSGTWIFLPVTENFLVY